MATSPARRRFEYPFLPGRFFLLPFRHYEAEKLVKLGRLDCLNRAILSRMRPDWRLSLF